MNDRHTDQAVSPIDAIKRLLFIIAICSVSGAVSLFSISLFF